jgi:hypothetical protein
VPAFSVTSSVKSFYAGSGNEECGDNVFSIERRNNELPEDCNQAETCIYDVRLDIAVPIPKPPCPKFNTTLVVKSGYAGTECANGENKFKIDPKPVDSKSCDDPGECVFDVDLEINIPIPKPPCPEFTVKTLEVNTGYEGSSCVSGRK